MSPLDADALVDRRRLKRQLSAWRALALVAVVGVAAATADSFDVLGFGDHVARLTLGGIILDDPDRLKAVAEAADDSSVAAMIVSIDSPGGTVVGGEALFRQLRRAAEKKPVVAVMGEVAASGGYMVALAADRIVAREGTITGSIGVIMQSTDVTGLLERVGIKPEAIKSGPLKAVPSPLEPLTEEARAATQSVVDDMYRMFVDMVAERRKLARPRAVELADGRVYTGRQALAVGLIDAIGGEREAREWLREMGVPARLPVRELSIEREDGIWREMVRGAVTAITGKTYFSERLTLDGLVAVWHPQLSR